MMAVFRVNKTDDYTVISNHHFREKGMSLKAKGLLSLMLSLPDDWDYSAKGLQTLSSDGRESLHAGINELKSFGYLNITRQQTDSGAFQYVYDVYESPDLNPSQSTGLPSTASRTTGRRTTGCRQRETSNNIILNINNTKSNTEESTTQNKSAAVIGFPVCGKYFEDDQVNSAFLDFVADRKERRKPMSTRAVNMAVKKVNELSKDDPDLAVKMIRQSIEHGWNGIFPFKEDQKNQAKNNSHEEYMERWRNA